MNGSDRSAHKLCRTFVLVHGAWHGAWCWDEVADRLRAEGEHVVVPTLTGLGERADEMSASITLDTFVADVAEAIERGSLNEVVLVGHSFAGAVVLGVADRMPRRLRSVILLDALVLGSGESAFGTMAPELVEARRRAVAEHGDGVAMPVPPPTAFGVADDHPAAARLRARLTPHPVGTYESPAHLRYAIGNGLPTTYVRCTAPDYEPTTPSWRRAQQQPGWRVIELTTGHDAMITAPDRLARLLCEVG